MSGVSDGSSVDVVMAGGTWAAMGCSDGADVKGSCEVADSVK